MTDTEREPGWWDIRAVRDEVGSEVYIGRATDLGMAYEYIQTLDDAGAWPEGHDALAVPRNSPTGALGTMFLDGDSWVVYSAHAEIPLRPATEKFRETCAMWGLKAANPEECVREYGWTGGPELLRVARRQLEDMDIVAYESYVDEDNDATVHFELYFKEPRAIPGVDDETTFVALSAPDVHGSA